MDRLRLFAVVLGLLLVTYAGIVEAMTAEIQSSAETERSLCKWLLLCADNAVLEEAYEQLSSVEPNAAEAAVAGFREALRRSPSDAGRWADLGEVLALSGAAEEAAYCFEQALRFGPHSPAILFRAAGFYDEVQQTEQSRSAFRQVLELTRAYDETVFAYFDDTQQPVDELLRYVIPDQPDALASYFRFEISDGSAENLAAAWNVLNERNLANVELLSAYVNRLVTDELFDEALSVRSRFLGDVQSSDEQNANVLFNGQFEENFIESALDWRIRPHDGIEIERVESDIPGDHALRIRFGGEENVDFRNVSQDFVVSPGRYRCSAWLRSEALTTDEGVALRIYDPSDQQQNLTSEAISGTADWTEVTLDFSATGGTQLLRLEVFRNRSRMFDNKISGSVWLDDVQCGVNG